MIEYRQGDILKAEAEALVNTVNCVGVMGRGLALQVKKSFPDVFRAYQAACKRGEVEPGVVLTHALSRLKQPQYVINVPTKRHWRGKSQLADVEAGLAALVKEVRELGVKSIAVPPLGCGLGGLDWSDVRPRIEHAFSELPDVQVLVFEPNGASGVEASSEQTKKPKMTEGRALLLCLMRRYLAAAMDPTVSVQEIHKLMYFMQASGQQLRLAFSRGRDGPCADNLRHVLTHIEGWYIAGFSDEADNLDKPIEPKPEAMAAAETFLKHRTATRQRFERVAALIAGFETPYGMTLLATVHWLANYENAVDLDQVVAMSHRSRDRKHELKPEHLAIAWDTLDQQDWLPRASPRRELEGRAAG